MSRKKRRNKGPRSGKVHKALCEKDVNGGGKAIKKLSTFIFDCQSTLSCRVHLKSSMG